MWMLVVMAFAGGLSSSDSVALTTVGAFQTEDRCIAAGDKIRKLESGTLKAIKYSCVRTY